MEPRCVCVCVHVEGAVRPFFARHYFNSIGFSLHNLKICFDANVWDLCNILPRNMRTNRRQIAYAVAPSAVL